MTWTPPAAAAASTRAARAVFDAAGFTPAGLAAALGRTGPLSVARSDLPVVRRWLAEDRSPLALLIRLFVVGDRVDADEAERVLGDGLERLAAVELVRSEGDEVAGTVEVMVHDDVLIASDRRDSGAEADVVPGLHRPSATLGALTVRRAVARALDVGTGNGIQAILVAPFAERVVATDVNERALAFAALNAGLNGRDNIELRAGSWLEPVAGERFQLAVSNPPYVISPESRYVFRDGGLGGDRVSAELAAALPEHLEPGGFASVMISWVQEGEVVGPRVRSWVSGRGCDALLLHSSVSPALAAAGSWNFDLAGDEDRFGAAVDEWNAYFRAEGIEAVGYGTLLIRRRAEGEGWFRAVELPERVEGQASDHLIRLFEGIDLVGQPDEQLLSRTLAVAPEGRVVQTLAPQEGTWQTARCELSLAAGMRFSAGLDRAMSVLVLALDGSRPVRDVLEHVAAAEGLPPSEQPRGLDAVRRLLELGFLVDAQRGGRQSNLTLK